MDTLPRSCKLVYGSLTDETFNDENVCLVVSQNSVTLQNFGAAQDVALKYPYGDIVKSRSQHPTMRSICDQPSRSSEGSCHIREPPAYKKSPTVATLINQYGIGKPFDYNMVIRQIIHNCSDEDYVNKVMADTRMNRVNHFRSSLNNLLIELTHDHSKYLNLVLIPAGIGCSGRITPEWLLEYLPEIYYFGKELKALGKECLIVCKENYLNVLSHKYNDNTEASTAFKKFKTLPVTDIYTYSDVFKTK